MTNSFEGGAFHADLTAATVTTAGAVLALANPEGRDLYVTRLILSIPDPSDGAATVDAGIAANGTTSSDNLIDGKSMATAGVFDNIKDAGSNGKAGQKWASDAYLTITASATLAGMTGAEAIIQYVPL